MRFHHILFLGFSLFLTSKISAHAQDCLNDCQSRLIQSYYHKLDTLSMAGSNENDINLFLDSLHEKVRYLHSQYEADFDKNIWRAAFLKHINNGRYQNSKEATTTINKVIHGHNIAAVEFISRNNDKDGNLIIAPPRLAIFKFQDGKISFIQDHWYHLIE